MYSYEYHRSIQPLEVHSFFISNVEFDLSNVIDYS